MHNIFDICDGRSRVDIDKDDLVVNCLYKNLDVIRGVQFLLSR